MMSDKDAREARKRKRFEAWVMSQPNAVERLLHRRPDRSYDYAEFAVQVGWESWQAAESQRTQAPSEQLVIDLARELYDRFVMGGWQPQDAHEMIREMLGTQAQAAQPESKND